MRVLSRFPRGVRGFLVAISPLGLAFAVGDEAEGDDEGKLVPGGDIRRVAGGRAWNRTRQCTDMRCSVLGWSRS